MPKVRLAVEDESRYVTWLRRLEKLSKKYGARPVIYRCHVCKETFPDSQTLGLHDSFTHGKEVIRA